MLNLPDELLLAVLRLLDPNDILKIRQTCSGIYLISLDRALWTDVVHHLSKSLPLPSRERIRTFTLSELEQAAVQAVKVEERWLTPRKAPLRRIAATWTSQKYPVDYLKLFENRFALAVYSRPCAVVLWDLDGLQLPENGGQYHWGRIVGKWIYEDRGAIHSNSCGARFHESSREIFVSFCLAVDIVYVSYVISISTSGNPAQEHSFRQVARVPQVYNFDSPLLSTCLNSEMSCIARGRQGPEAIEITHLEHSYSRSIMTTSRTDPDEPMFPYWIAMEFCGPYIIAVKPNVLQIYVLPDDLGDKDACRQVSTHVETFALPDRNFRSASLSLLSKTTETMDHSAPLSVVLVLADPFDVVLHYILHLPRDPNTAVSFTATLVGTDVSLPIRGVFIGSELSLGPRGMRAAWIEKSRNSMERRVVAFTAGDENASDAHDAQKMRTSPVYLTSSPDFSEDIIHLDCDEVTGRIVVATRGGELWVLDCWGKLPVERKPLARFQGRNMP